MIKKRILPLLVLLSFISFAFHPFHFGVTEMQYNVQSQTLEISCKLFTNDLENILKKKYGQHTDLVQQHESANVKELLQKYIREHLHIKSGQQYINYSILGSEHEDSAIWIHLESQKLVAPKELSIQNSLLFDLFDDQANILHLDINGQKKSYKLQNPTSSQIFNFY